MAPQNYQRLFNFAPLMRYRWRAQDFLDMQDNGTFATIRASLQALTGAAVLTAFDYSSNAGLVVTASSGVAFGPTGEVMVITASSTGTFASPTGGNPARSLVVVRPNLSTPASGYITEPTAPLEIVPLFIDHYAQVVVIDGTPSASPVYPSTQANDVILFGVRLAAGATGFLSTDVDYEVRDYLGKNSLLEHRLGKADNRLRPYSNGSQSVGIKPSQTVGSFPKLFTYINQTIPSIFPKAGGVFVTTDTFLNFQTGVITGGDTTSVAFTPSIPAAGTFKVAAVSLATTDTLVVQFGTNGTYAQCVAAINNQTLAGAGSIPTIASTYPICWVILASLDGTNISSLDVIDARSVFMFGGTAALPTEVDLNPATQSPYTVSSGNDGQKIFNVNSLNGTMQMNLPAPVRSFQFDLRDSGFFMGVSAATLHRNASEKINGVAADLVLSANGGRWRIYSDGTDWFVN